MKLTNMLLVLILLVLGILIYLEFDYSKKGYVINTDNNRYLKLAQEKLSHSDPGRKVMIPMDTAVANLYLNAFDTSFRPMLKPKAQSSIQTVNEQPKGIILDINTISFLYNYMLQSGKKILIGLAKFDSAAIHRSGYTDVDLNANPKRMDHIALIFGVLDENKRMSPFITLFKGAAKPSYFFDDWNEEWP